MTPPRKDISTKSNVTGRSGDMWCMLIFNSTDSNQDHNLAVVTCLFLDCTTSESMFPKNALDFVVEDLTAIHREDSYILISENWRTESHPTYHIKDAYSVVWADTNWSMEGGPPKTPKGAPWFCT